MPIYYCLIAKEGGVVLTEYTSYQGNFAQYGNELIPKITPNSMKTFELSEFFFHYVNEFGISVMCMTDKKMERKMSFAFLQDVKKALLDYYTARDLQNAQQNSLGTFKDTIRDKIVSETPISNTLCV